MRLALDFLKNVQVLRGFVCTLDMTQTVAGREPAAQRTDIWTAISTNTLGTFSYRDDAGNTRSYLVRVMRPSGSELTGTDERSEYTVYMSEFNP